MRRRFLDMESSRLKPLYYSRLRDYYRALRQRNQLLKEHRGGPFSDFSILDPWEQTLVKVGSWIVKERIQLLEDLENLAKNHFSRLTGGLERLSLGYISTINFGGEREQIERSFKEQLSKARSAEFRKGSTLVGPHLDDFAFLINGLDARKFASQGQQRSAVLALKMGEADLFNSSGDERAILLLDDVFSEFDESRRRHILQFISERDDQSFITTAVPLPDFKRYQAKKTYFFTVSGGRLRLIELGQIIEQVLRKRKMWRQYKQCLIIEQWDQLVGKEIAAVTRAWYLQRNVLRVLVRDSTWAYHLTLLKPKLIEELNRYAGENLVRDIYFQIGLSREEEFS